MFIAGAVALGLLTGLFVNVVIVRIPAGEAVLCPLSKCPLCHAAIGATDSVPIISWFRLRARCRHCDQPIHWGYPVVEALNGLLWGLAAWRFGPHLLLVPYLFCFSVLLALSAIDIQIYRLPDKITFTAGAISLVMLTVVALVEGEPMWIGAALVSGIAYFLFLLLPAIVYPRGMGFGDVKLVGLLGLYLGFLTPTYIPVLAVLSVVISSVIGLVVGLGVLVARGGKSQPYPFGPWLALGCIVSIVFSPQLLGLYGL